MNRRRFLQSSAVVAAGVASKSVPQSFSARWGISTHPIPKRKLGGTAEELSIVGLGGVVQMNNSPSFASSIVSEAIDRGINYFDVAPTYDNAQERLGPALEPYRKNCFLA